jgi:peroxiredoxin
MRATLAILTALLAGCDAGSAVKLNVGDAAPAFDARRLDGSSVRFPQDYAGRAVALRFWADWCRYCEDEMKGIEPIYRQRRRQGLEVLAVNVGQAPDKVSAFVGKLGISYPALLDEPGDIARRYGVMALPTTYFVDAGGVIRGKVLGEADAASFDRLAGELLQ